MVRDELAIELPQSWKEVGELHAPLIEQTWNSRN